jgi:hypothetical protein
MKHFILPIVQHYWSAALAAAIAFVWIAFYTKHSGIGISPDSVAYLSTANHIAQDFIFTDYTHNSFVNFPLGYPIFLALLNCTVSLPIISLAPFTNSCLLASVLFVTNHLLIKISIKSGLIKLLLLLLILSSPPLLEVYSMLWSETLFILFVLLFFCSLNKYCSTISIKWLLTSALLASLAIEIRYAGVTILITGIIFILLKGKIGFVKKIFHLLIFGVLGCILPSTNIIYNKLHSGTWAGVRQLATRSFSNNLVDFTAVLNGWFSLPKAINIILMSICICLVLCYSFYLLYKFSQQHSTQFYIVILSCFSIVYGLFMLFIASVSRFETLSSRLISPIYIPLMVVLINWIATFIRSKLGWWKRGIAVFVAILFGLQAQHHYQLHAAAWEGIGYAGIPGYTEDQWTNSAMIQYLKKEYRNYSSPIYSNANDAIYFLTTKQAFPLPHKHLPEEINLLMKHPSFYLVWFNDGQNNDLINLRFILQQKKLKCQWKFEDGTIYYFTN